MYHCVIIGSGFSGLCMGIKLLAAGIEDFVILEKADNLGGTWRENTYPGAECDIPSALYSFSFEPYPDWNYKWSEQSQILQYLNHCADKYQLRDKICFKSRVVSLVFKEVAATWVVQLENETSLQAKTVVSAIGQLHHPKLPAIKGINDFQGSSFHSARWNHEIDLKNKNIAVIGNGASAIQFIPEIAKEAKSLKVYQRSANWIIAKPDRAYRKWEKELTKRYPSLLRLQRLRIWLSAGLLYTVCIQSRALNFIVKWKTKWILRKSIKDKTLQKTLIPDFPPGAKRTLFSDDYYPALSRKNVDVITEGIEEICLEGIKTKNGKTETYDHIIYATGFETNPFLKYLKVKGLNGQALKEKWATGEKSYFGICTQGFPNFFMLYGPNTNLGHNSIVLMSEAQSNYIAQCIQELDKQKCQYLDVKKEVEAAFDAEMQKRLKKSVWATVPQSWYKNGNRIPNNWPGRTMEYRRRTKKMNPSDFNFI